MGTLQLEEGNKKWGRVSGNHSLSNRANHPSTTCFWDNGILIHAKIIHYILAAIADPNLLMGLTE